MKALFQLLSILGLLISVSGCAICCAPDDGTYPVSGGLYQRNDPTSGRVGSAFTHSGEAYESTDAPEGGQEPTEAEPEKTNSDEPPAPVIASEGDDLYR